MLAAPGPSTVFQGVTMMSMRCICALSYGEDGITKTKWHLLLFWYIFVIATWCVLMGGLHHDQTQLRDQVAWPIPTTRKISIAFFLFIHMANECFKVSHWTFAENTFCIKSFWYHINIDSHEVASVVLHVAAKLHILEQRYIHWKATRILMY